MDNDTGVYQGRVLEHPHIIPAVRQYPHVGDVVSIRAGKHTGRTGKVAGKNDGATGVIFTVMRDDGVIIGVYSHDELIILREGS